MPSPLRILVVHDHIGHPHGVIHGPSRYLLNVLPRLDRRAFEFHVCFLRGWHPAARLFEEAGIEPIFLGRQKWDPRSLTDVVALMRRHRIDLLHASGMKASLLTRVVSRFERKPTIVHFRDSLPVASAVTHLHRLMANWADLAICISTAIAARAQQDFGVPAARTIVLHNGVPLDDFRCVPADARQRIRDELGIASDAPVVGIVARFDPVKQHELLIRAMPAVLRRCPDAVLLAAGDGTTRSSCERLVENLGLRRSVRFAGYRSDIPAIMAATDVVAMPSASEGLGNAAIEALAAGKPVVAFRVGGLAEVVIDGRTGFLVAPGDAGALGERLADLLSDTTQRAAFSREAITAAVRFSIETHVDRLQQIYRMVARAV